jgi:hypothetical protein
MTITNLKFSRQVGASFGESPVNHRTRFLQGILRSGHDALDPYGQALIVSFIYAGP